MRSIDASPDRPPRLDSAMIAIDWGTSSFRAYRLAGDGAVREQRDAAAGLLACAGRFEAVLAQQIAGWDDALVVMSGMVGSRNGWCEVPYVECPAGASEIAAGLHEIAAPTLPGHRIWIVPGVSYRPLDDQAEVMRGEETQVLGLLDRLPGSGPHAVCLPGTHSKWVRVKAGRITALRTAMTGELYALLRRHSLLAALMPAGDGCDDVDDAGAFARGVAASAGAAGLAHHLFGVRTAGLFGTLTPTQAPSYLSGLLIGHELRGWLAAERPTVHLVGRPALADRYARALALLDADARIHAEELTAGGLFRVAKVRGLPC